MNINVPDWAREHFWVEPPSGSQEFWGFRFRPPCSAGDKLYFRFDGTVVATATVDRIEAPGRSKCEGTGRFGNVWKVFWTNESFEKIERR